mmetsp:Transcript_14605/g.29784  ORF Transcript_14605/g.29784 Transcript_14605/m.29784 type:complete len:1073 (-) Transcript_14605:34-3252(-)
MTTINNNGLIRQQIQQNNISTTQSNPSQGQLNLSTLCNALQSSFSANKLERDQAESALKSIDSLPNACPLLLQIICSRTDVPEPIRSAAAIYLKNITRKHWGGPPPPSPDPSSLLPSSPARTNQPPAAPTVHPADKPSIKAGVVNALMTEPSKPISRLLAECLHNLCVAEYPHSWPDLLPTLLSNVVKGGQESDPVRVLGSLVGLRKLCKRYEYKSSAGRAPLKAIIDSGLPLLLQVLQALARQEMNPHVGNVIKQTLKVFWSCTQFNMSDSDALTYEALLPWFACIHDLLKRGMPPPEEGMRGREREKWVWCKVQKWSVQIMTRMYSRYGNPKAAEAGLLDFAQKFSQGAAVTFMGPVCETLAVRVRGGYVSPRVVMLCLSYLDTAIEQKSTWTALKPHLNFVVFDVCFDVVKLEDEDVELLNDDPHEYIARGNDIMSEFVDPRVMALTLVEDLVKFRTSSVARVLVDFLKANVAGYGASADHRGFEASLQLLGTLAKFMKDPKSGFSQDLPELLIRFVLPQFGSAEGYVRARSLWVVSMYYDLPFGGHFGSLVEGVLLRLSDPCLPVQVEAGKALQFLIQVPGTETSLLPVLPRILDEYFRIMREIGNDDVLTALDIIVEKFGDHIAPHAVSLVANLSGAFARYCETEDDEDMEAASAASQSLECISTVLRVVQDDEEIFRASEPHLLPVIAAVLDPSGSYVDNLEYGLDLLTFLTYFQSTFSPGLWSLFPMVVAAFHEFAFDFVGLMSTPLDNFIVKDFSGFCGAKTASGEKYIDLLFGMVKKVVEAGEDTAEESEVRKALGLFLSVFHTASQRPESKPFIDQYLPAATDITLSKLKEKSTADFASTRVQCYTVLGALLFYNVSSAAAELERRSALGTVVGMWMQDAADVEKRSSKKGAVLGWLALISLGSERLQRSGVDMADLVRGVIELGKSLSDDYDRAGEEDDDDGLDDDDVANAAQWGDMDGPQGFDGADEDGDIDILGKNNAEMMMFAGGGFGGKWDDDDDDDEFESPIDDVNEFVVLEEVFARLAQSEPAKLEAIKAGLPPDTLAAVGELIKAAQTYRASKT